MIPEPAWRDFVTVWSSILRCLAQSGKAQIYICHFIPMLKVVIAMQKFDSLLVTIYRM